MFGLVGTPFARSEIGASMEELVEVVLTALTQRLKNDAALVEPSVIDCSILPELQALATTESGTWCKAAKALREARAFGRYLDRGGAFFFVAGRVDDGRMPW